MKLSTKSRYAVMALIDLASTTNTSSITLATIAQRQALSLTYLEQLFLKLRRFGIVNSTRGVGGGYTLARPAKDILIYEVILAAEGPVKILRCKNQTQKGCQTHGKFCNAHNLWHELEKALIGFFSKITLDDVIQNKIINPVVILENKKIS